MWESDGSSLNGGIRHSRFLIRQESSPVEDSIICGITTARTGPVEPSRSILFGVVDIVICSRRKKIKGSSRIVVL